jgi:hypothetical protein
MIVLLEDGVVFMDGARELKVYANFIEKIMIE